jgi:hypothetical protein
VKDVCVPVSPGELIDKFTILEIKTERIHDTAKLAHIRYELEALRRAAAEGGLDWERVRDLKDALRIVNIRLWEIEDDIRLKEKHSEFDADFIRLARSVYHENDSRAALKREINQRLGSALVEEKSYADYKSDGLAPP